MVGVITAWGVRWTGLVYSPKTDSDHSIKDNLVHYCPKTFETAKGKTERWCSQELNPGPLTDCIYMPVHASEFYVHQPFHTIPLVAVQTLYANSIRKGNS